MEKNKATLESELRNDILDSICGFLSEHYGVDTLRVSASEIAIPCLDSEKNEKFGLIKVSIPRGTRTGEGGYTPYDGYAAHEAYLDEIKEKEAKKAASAEKKAMAEKLREQKRALRETKKKNAE